jgi:IS5 family transposase
VDDPVWDASVFSKNRDRLLAGEVAQRFLAEILALPEVRRLLSSEHFSVDGPLIQAWASLKSFRRKDGGDAPPAPGRNCERSFKGEKRSNATHASTTDPDARLYRKGNGQPADLCYLGHALMENRNGLIVAGVSTRATGDAEPLAAIELVKAMAGRRRITLGADKAYDTANFVMECREEKVTPHVAQNITTTRGSRIDGRTTRHPGYAASLRVRKRIEEGFGWVKEIAGLAQVKLRGLARVDCAFVLGLAAYNLVRLPKLLAEASP